jgi:predicted nucleic acid-binding protein
MNAIDTNILIYGLDVSENVKRVKAQDLLNILMSQAGGTVLLWQVAVEFLAFLRKSESKGFLSAERAETSFRDILRLFPLHRPTIDVLDRSFGLRKRYSLSHWDSLLIAACGEAGVVRLYSEDMQHGATYDGVSIVNPFV